MSEIVAVCLADVHVHAFRQFSNYSSGDNSRRLEILRALRYVVVWAARIRADLIIIAGDLFHEKTKVDVVSMVEVDKILQETSVPILIASGNHDQTYSGHSSVSMLEKGMVHVDREILISSKARRGEPVFYRYFKAVPYYSLRAYLNGNESVDRKTILVTHGELYDPEIPYNQDAVRPEELLEKHDIVIMGHQHNVAEWVSATSIFGNLGRADSGILLPGALIPHNFGEPNPGYFWELHISEDAIRVNRIEMEDFPRFITYRVVRTEGGINYGIDGMPLPPMEPKNYYRLIISYSDLRPFIPPGMESRVVVVFDPSPVESGVQPMRIVDFSLSPSELVTEYFQSRAGSLPEGLRDMALRLGQKLFDDSIDMEELFQEFENAD